MDKINANSIAGDVLSVGDIDTFSPGLMKDALKEYSPLRPLNNAENFPLDLNNDPDPCLEWMRDCQSRAASGPFENLLESSPASDCSMNMVPTAEENSMNGENDLQIMATVASQVAPAIDIQNAPAELEEEEEGEAEEEQGEEKKKKDLEILQHFYVNGLRVDVVSSLLSCGSQITNGSFWRYEFHTSKNEIVEHFWKFGPLTVQKKDKTKFGRKVWRGQLLLPLSRIKPMAQEESGWETVYGRLHDVEENSGKMCLVPTNHFRLVKYITDLAVHGGTFEEVSISLEENCLSPEEKSKYFVCPLGVAKPCLPTGKAKKDIKKNVLRREQIEIFICSYDFLWSSAFVAEIKERMKFPFEKIDAAPSEVPSLPPPQDTHPSLPPPQDNQWDPAQLVEDYIGPPPAKRMEIQ